MSLGMFAFENCNGLKEVKSYINKPFSISTLCFNKVNTDVITLYVPAGTKAKYEVTEGWKEFKKIIEMEGSAINGIIIDDTRTSSIYTLSGKQLVVPQKGINIINGRKVVVK